MNIEVRVIKKIALEGKKVKPLEICLYWYKQLEVEEVVNNKEIILKREKLHELLKDAVDKGQYEIINETSFVEDEINTVDKLKIGTKEAYKYLLIINGTIIIEELDGYEEPHRIEI